MATASRAQMVRLCNFMGSMLDSGLAVSRMLAGLQERTDEPAMQAALSEAEEAVKEGSTLTEAFSRSGYFGAFFTSLIEVGEVSGRLDVVAQKLGDFYEMQQRQWRHLVDRMVPFAVKYFLAITILAVGAYVAARLRGGNSPLVSSLALGYGIPIVLAVLIWMLWRDPSSGALMRRAAEHVPGVSAALSSLALARFSFSMRLLLEADTPMRRALKLSLRATDDPVYEESWDRIEWALEDGAPLWEALKKSFVFPRMLVETVAAGETAGEICGQFAWLEEQYSEEYRRAVDRIAGFLAAAMKAMAFVLVLIHIFALIQGAGSGMGG